MELADDLLRNARQTEEDDFSKEGEIRIPCVSREFVIDWSKEPDDHQLVRWEEM